MIQFSDRTKVRLVIIRLLSLFRLLYPQKGLDGFRGERTQSDDEGVFQVRDMGGEKNIFTEF
jgi:hypothetical protein